MLLFFLSTKDSFVVISSFLLTEYASARGWHVKFKQQQNFHIMHSQLIHDLERNSPFL